MGRIVQLQNKKTGENEYPRTYTKAIIDDQATPLDTLMQNQNDKIAELGSELGRGILALNITNIHSSTRDKVNINVEEGDVVVINQFADKPMEMYSVVFFNSITNAQESHNLRQSEQNKIEAGGSYDSMGFYIEVNEPVNVTIEYFTHKDFKSILSSGIMGIVGKENGMSLPDINSNTGDMTISNTIGLIVNGFYYSIPPQTFNLKNSVSSSMTKIVYDSKTKLCRAVSYIKPISRYDIVIGTARTTYAEDGSFKSLYHVHFPFEYSIDGQTKLGEIDSKTNYIVLLGANNERQKFVYSNVIAGHSYRIYCKNPNWDVSDLSISDDQFIFEIYTEYEGESKYIYSVKFGNKGSIKEYYDFNIPSDTPIGTTLSICIRGNKGIKAYFYIEDTTNVIFDIKKDRNNMFFIGDNANFVSTKFRGIVGHRYRLHLLSKSWEYPSTIGNDVSVYFIGAHTEDGSVTLKSYNKSNTLPSSYTFEYKSEYTDVYVGGRALKNEKVFFEIEDITEKKYNDKFVLVGDGNNGITEKIYLEEGVEYSVLLPTKKWNLDGITLDYNYYYFELYYSDNGNSVVVDGLLRDSVYKNRFSFLATKSTEYTLYIRASKNEIIPISIVPRLSTAYESQIDKIRSLGFKRQPDTIDETYIPNLVFMHMSDTHCTKTSYQESFKKSVGLFNGLCDGEKYYGNALKFILHTGDLRYGHYSDGYDFFYVITENLKKNIYVTPGNHDVGNDYNVSHAGTNEDIYNQMIAPMLEKWVLNSDGVDLPHIEGKNYYFNDFTDEKIRLVVLYEYETDFELSSSDSSKLKYHRGYRAFSQGQIDWLIQTLRNTPQGYGVIIAKHQPESTNGFTDNPFYSNMLTEKNHMQTYCGYDLVAQIVQAFIDRTVFNTIVEQTGGVVTTLNVNADFSSLTESEFICYCSGHTHLDMITKLKYFPNQIELNIGPNNTHYTNGTDIYQNGDGVTGLLTNVYSVDRNRGFIYVVRLGADFSNTAQHRSFIALKYK